MEMEKQNRSWFQGILLVGGVLCVAYGVAEKNHPVFILGLLIGIVAYLLIRKQLKDSIRKKP
ncbi:MAG: hypothetical protein CVU57_25635 [Deltaproteobacteria bacterium HGW-Deltaproteobacteria-15]|nr:MAG: hypothetical protein CVU57_25635 [Deltaproteobacteria bacterium HGW-Deltaproteobacteria-15]